MSRSAWVCLNYGTNRSYAGNQGYEDDLNSYYRYDSFVPNHRSVKPGDVLLICDRERLQGVAIIEEIEITSGFKAHDRCPECGISGIKDRKTKKGYRCNNGHEFNKPHETLDECTLFEARYSHSFGAVKTYLPRTVLRDGYLNNARQQSIRRFSPGHAYGLAVAADVDISRWVGYEVEAAHHETLKHGPGGESSAHRDLKNWIKDNPEQIGVLPTYSSEVEHRYMTGNRVDVQFSGGEVPQTIVVEVEVEGERNIEIGIHQAVMYRTLAALELGLENVGISDDVRAVLVAYETDYPRAKQLAETYGVDCYAFDRKLIPSS